MTQRVIFFPHPQVPGIFYRRLEWSYTNENFQRLDQSMSGHNSYTAKKRRSKGEDISFPQNLNKLSKMFEI